MRPANEQDDETSHCAHVVATLGRSNCGSVRIYGSKSFIRRTKLALRLLKRIELGDIVQENITSIRQRWTNLSYPFSSRRVCAVEPKVYSLPIKGYASALAKKAYRTSILKRGSGISGEQEADVFFFQEKVLKQLNASNSTSNKSCILTIDDNIRRFQRMNLPIMQRAISRLPTNRISTLARWSSFFQPKVTENYLWLNIDGSTSFRSAIRDAAEAFEDSGHCLRSISAVRQSQITVFGDDPVPTLYVNWECWDVASLLGLLRLLSHESFRATYISAGNSLAQLHKREIEVASLQFTQKVLSAVSAPAYCNARLQFFDNYLTYGGDVRNWRRWHWLTCPRDLPFTNANLRAAFQQMHELNSCAGLEDG